MNEYEKEVMRLLDAHEKAEKGDLIKRINMAISHGGIKRSGKNEWVCKVTGSPMGTVCTWFTNSRCRAVNKISVYAMCQIAAALKISVWQFFKTERIVQENEEPKIDRRGKLYWHLRRNEAPQLWNSSYGYYGAWEMQSKAVQRQFLDNLYMERMAEQAEKENG